MILLELFLSFLQIGALSFGGGYAAMPLIQEQVVIRHAWLTMDTFGDLVTIAEMTPGPIAINAATFVGTRIAGAPGAIAATLGCVFPSCIFVTALACLYMKFRGLTFFHEILGSLRPAVVAMIAKAGITILVSALFVGGTISFSNLNFRMAVWFCLALFLLRKKKWNPILAMVLCGGLELLSAYLIGA